MDFNEKLDSIIVPEIEIRDVPLPETLQYLQREAWRLDTEPRVSKEDDLVIPGLPEAPVDPVTRGVPICWLVYYPGLNVNLVLHDTDLRTALLAVADQVGLALHVNTAGVYLLPLSWIDKARLITDRSDVSQAPLAPCPAFCSSTLAIIDPAADDLDTMQRGESAAQFEQRRDTGLVMRAQAAMAAGDQVAFEAIPPDAQALALSTPSLGDWTDENASRALVFQVQRAENLAAERGYGGDLCTVISRQLWEAFCRAKGIHPDVAFNYGPTLRVIDSPAFVSFTFVPGAG
jgi:hypothetical protein